MFAESSDQVQLWWKLEGVGPTVALIPGRGDSTDVFPRCFVDRMIGAGLSVLRTDPRDTGLSGDGGDNYTMSTMADDLVAVLDAAGTERAHLLALSMGGLILTDLASRLPARVASITFLSAMSPEPDAGMGPDFFAGIGSDPVEGTLAAMGSPTEADRVWFTAEVARAHDRAHPRPDAGERHQAAAFRLSWPEPERLGEIAGHALVVHGSADRTLPVAHAHALANGIPDSTLRVIDGMGHLATRTEWDKIADLVIEQVHRP